MPGPIIQRPAALRFRAGIALLAALAPACTGDREAALRRVLAEERQAHLATDAGLLARNLADTLISIDDGVISFQPRARVREQFEGYFAGARYSAWEDDVAPVIRIGPSGDLAWVARRVRVARDEPDLGGGTTRRAFTGAWTATYTWTDGGWRMTSVTSTFVPDSPAERLLAGARRAVGAAALARVRTVRAVADARGPTGPFRVTVISRRSGEARLDFSGGLSAGLGRRARWLRAADSVGPLTPAMETFLRGHELHLSLLAAETRYRELGFGGTVELDGRPALSLVGRDALGGRVELFYSPSDTLPLGYRVMDQVRRRGTVTVTVGDWERRDGLRLFTSATFRQGVETFRYRFTAIELDPPVADSTFEAP